MSESQSAELALAIRYAAGAQAALVEALESAHAIAVVQSESGSRALVQLECELACARAQAVVWARRVDTICR